jgi:hypothetical protein
MPARQYRSTVEAKTLNQTITNSSTAIVLNSVTTLPTTYPYTLVLNPDTLTEEIVTVTSSGGGNTLNVTRGQDGTTAQAHNLGAAVRHMITARDLQEPQDHINNGGYHVIVCTSSTRPGSPVDGQHIYETDTDKTLSWDGTAWNPVSGAASYQAGEPANPSVGSLWVDSDETASQLNTNDFLLKADASASTGYVSKVGGDTVVASGAAVKPLVLKGASSQTANLQEWQDSTGAVVASVSPTGNITGGGLVHINTTTFSSTTTLNMNNIFSAGFNDYRILLKLTSQAGTWGYVTWQSRNSGTTDTTSANFQVNGNINRVAVVDFLYQSGTTSGRIALAGFGTNTQGFTQIEMMNPFVAQRTGYSTISTGVWTDGTVATIIAAGLKEVQASHDGMTFNFPSAATGVVTVYGYRTS